MKKIRKDDINLLEAYAYKTPFYEKMKPHVIYFLIPMVFACLCTVIYILVFTNMLGHNQSLLQQNKAELTSLQSTTEELMSTADYQAYIDNKNTYETLKDMQKVIETYPEMNQKALSTLMENYQTIRSVAYNQQEHSLTIEYKSYQQSFYYDMISKMRKTGYFRDIEYVGYTGVDDQTTTQSDDGTQTITQSTRKYASTIVYKLK